MIKHKLLVNPKSRESLKTLFDKIKEEPEEVEVFVCNKKVTRSKAQRGYYFAVVVAIVSQATGMTLEETNEELKLTFNSKTRINTKGETVTYGASIENEPTAKVEQIYSEIRKAFDEMDIHIPEPQKISNDTYVDVMELHKKFGL